MPDTQEEALKKRLLHQRQDEIRQQLMQQALQAQLKAAMTQVLDAKARERLANIKAVKPELAVQLELYLAQLYQSGQLAGRLSDEQLVQILQKLQHKPEWKIRRK